MLCNHNLTCNLQHKIKAVKCHKGASEVHSFEELVQLICLMPQRLMRTDANRV